MARHQEGMLRVNELQRKYADLLADERSEAWENLGIQIRKFEQQFEKLQRMGL
jgi:hypothetical protein